MSDHELRQAAWQIVIDGVAGGLPIPAEVSIPGHYDIFDIRLPLNDQDGADVWAAHLGLATPKLEKPLSSGARTYRAGTYDFPKLPGWLVRVSCFVEDVAEDGAQ